MKKINSDIDLQRQYYANTASLYDEMHLSEEDEHYFALSAMLGLLDYLGVQSILDIGSGTGRALRFIKKNRPDIRIMGIEPVEELREEAYKSGVSPETLIDGDATTLNFQDGDFDLVCEFGMLHHVRFPEQAVAEMLRVSKKCIFISDNNNFGCGTKLERLIKQTINLMGLWNYFDLLKTSGKGYRITEGDGLAYSYSVFNNYKYIRSSCRKVHIMNTQNSNINLYKTASHVALLGIK